MPDAWCLMHVASVKMDAVRGDNGVVRRCDGENRWAQAY